jgi:CheY-like chemotaxis protein
LKEISLGSLIFDIYENYYDKVHSKGLGFSMHLPENSEDFIVKTDPEILKKILLHLLDNAVKYTDQGRITLGFDFERNHLELFVEDTGIGIPNHEQPKLFRHFSRIDNVDTPNYDGSGLSLSISKGFAKLLNSDIKVESTAGKGSKFSILFNIEQILINYDLALKISEIRKKVENPVILIADDDQTSLMLLSRILKSQTDAKIIQAKNGKEAVQIFSGNPDISCVLMDLKMPYLNGYEATKQIKVMNAHVPVIAVTAFAMVGDQKAALESGCDDYISKPFSLEQIGIMLKKFGIPCK